ncbi:MAG: hypothetical protein Q4G07_05660 [Oscillospiraceae bacterium]|nr:hypothetical protein [Oscillospiraceae bacterium]
MRNCTKIDEFKQEAQHALFTKQQAISVVTRLLQLEAADNENHTPEEQRQLQDAAARVDFTYLDFTATGTDTMLDSFGVARITAEDILNALNVVLFEVE